MTLPRKMPRAPPSPAPKKTGARISPGDDHLQPPTPAHQPPPAEADLNLPQDPTIHHEQTRTAPLAVAAVHHRSTTATTTTAATKAATRSAVRRSRS